MTREALPDIECACANIRRAARLVTQLYSHEMGGEIEPTQFALLTVLEQQPGCRQALLGEMLGIDKTSLSRNLRLIDKNGWIERAESSDQRERGYHLTATGRKLLAATQPKWKRAQRKLRDAITPAEWETMHNVFDRVARASLAVLKPESHRQTGP